MLEFKRTGIKDSDLFDLVDLDGAARMVINVDKAIRSIPDHPHEGCIFRDITPLFLNQQVFRDSIMGMVILCSKMDESINKIVTIESRGWIYGSILADRLNLPMAIARKHGILPAGTVTKPYGSGEKMMRLHRDAIEEGDKVLIVDDIIITGKSTLAAAQCVEALGGKVGKIIALADLDGQKGKKMLRDKGYDTKTVLTYPGQ